MYKGIIHLSREMAKYILSVTRFPWRSNFQLQERDIGAVVCRPYLPGKAKRNGPVNCVWIVE